MNKDVDGSRLWGRLNTSWNVESLRGRHRRRSSSSRDGGDIGVLSGGDPLDDVGVGFDGLRRRLWHRTRGCLREGRNGG